jgi:thioredoxin-related protein
MDRTSTLHGSTRFSNENESELIKLAGFLDSEEFEAVSFYLKGLQNDVNDDVVRRIVDFSRNYTQRNLTKENVVY